MFWETAFDFIPELVSLRERDSITKKTPTFIHERRNLYKNDCPEVQMKFGFKNKMTGVIETVDCTAAPVDAFQRNPNYVKVFEESYVQVRHRLRISSQ